MFGSKMKLFEVSKDVLIIVLFYAASSQSDPGIVQTLSGKGLPHMGEVEICLEDSTSLDGDVKNAKFSYPWGIVYDKEKAAVYVADCGCLETPKENDRIRKIDLHKGVVSTPAGSLQGYNDGDGAKARFSHTSGMVLDQATQKMYIADSGNNVIRVMDLNTNKVETFAGKREDATLKDGPVDVARFSSPQQLELHESTTRMFVGDTDNHAIRMILMKESPPKVITITGGPEKEGYQDGPCKEAKWKHPTGVAYDAKRDALYVSDHYNHAVRKVDLKSNYVTTIAGNGMPGVLDASINGGLHLYYPEGIVHDPEYDILYVAEFTNNCIRMIKLEDNSVSVLAGGEFGTRDAVGRDAQFYHPTTLDLDPVNKLLFVTDQYNHRIRTVTAVGNKQSAQSNVMMLKHFAKLDAYRDIVVHNNRAFWIFIYVAAIILMVMIILFGKKLIRKRCRNSSAFNYQSLSKRP